MTAYADVLAIAKPAGRDRIVIGGVDLSDFRGVATPFPGYGLIEPYAYGPTSITFPQVDAAHEEIGAGDLAWCHWGAPVYLQRVMPDATIKTDYVGVLISFTADGRTLRVDVGGRLEGRATLIDRPPPVVRRVRDIGRWVQLACQDINIPMSQPLGPVTGIEIPDQGDTTLLDWFDNLSTMSQTLSGVQSALMPITWGKNPWHFTAKDRTTKHVTLFNDDAVVVCTLTSDASGTPNTWYASGSTHKGTRWKGAKYPRYFQDEDPPPYPFADNRNFGIGTTDAETDTGDGIEVLKDALLGFYLESGFGYTGVYDQNIYDAVELLKHEAGLSANGTMTTAAWAALFDLDVTGYSNVGAGIRPIRQNSNVRKWNETANGNLISRNDDFDANALRVDRTLGFGPGVEMARGRKFIRGQAARTAGPQYTGTIRLNGFGGFAGEWNPGDTPTSADVMSYRDIRPGMNAWLPLFAGGILVHIAGVDVDADGATLTVDTAARDLMEAREIIARNRESVRNPHRQWRIDQRGGKPSGFMVTRDQYFGLRRTNKALAGGTWTVVPVIVGQSGTISHVHLQLLVPTEFCYSVWSQKVTRKQLLHNIGDPFPLNGDRESVWEQARTKAFRNKKLLLFAKGTVEQPCGYGDQKKFNDIGVRTSAVLSGLDLDDGNIPYLSDDASDPVIWLAIYPRDETALKRGLVFTALQDDSI